jgi:hypothetical protein
MISPWELIRHGDKFLPPEEFPVNDVRLHKLFCALWKAARDDVQAATKISFVGLSVHPFLEDELRYLFNGKEGAPLVVVANPANVGEARVSFDPVRPAGKVRAMLKGMCPGLHHASYPHAESSNYEDVPILVLKSFEQFIAQQMF